MSSPDDAPAPADLSAGEDDSEFYTPKASDLQQQGEEAGRPWDPAGVPHVHVKLLGNSAQQPTSLAAGGLPNWVLPP